MNLLIIRLSALGDVAMCIPAIYNAATQHNDANVYVLTTERFSQLFVDAPSNLHIIKFNRNEHRSFFGYIKLIKQLHQLHITHVADLHNVSRSWWIDISFLLSGAKVKMLDKQRSKRKKMLSGTYNISMFEAQDEVFKALNIPQKHLFKGFQFTDEQFPLPNFIPNKTGTERWIGVAPFARYNSKIYPLELIAEVIDTLSALPQMRLFLFGGGETEKRWCEKQASKANNIYTLPGRLQLMQEMHLMQALDIMISMDSANQHIASLMNTPVLTIWGGTSPRCGFQAWNQEEKNQMCAHVVCQPCTIAGSDVCPLHNDFRCMRAISPQKIVETIKELLKK